MISDLQGKVAVVTGGASGIGYALAGRLVREGMSVVIADVEPGPLQAAAEALGALAVRADVADFDSIQALAHQARHAGDQGEEGNQGGRAQQGHVVAPGNRLSAGAKVRIRGMLVTAIVKFQRILGAPKPAPAPGCAHYRGQEPPGRPTGP